MNQVTKPALAQSNFLAPLCTVEGEGLEGALPSQLPGGGASAHVSGWWEQVGGTQEWPNLCVQELILTRSVFLRSVRVPSWYIDDQGTITSWVGSVVTVSGVARPRLTSEICAPGHAGYSSETHLSSGENPHSHLGLL